MNPIESYIYSRAASQRDIMIFFHNILTKQFELSPFIKWKVPVYYGNSWLIYLNPDLKSDSVHLCFANGFLLSDKYKILERKGRKLVSSILIKNIEAIPYQQIIEIIEESVTLDKEKHQK